MNHNYNLHCKSLTFNISDLVQLSTKDLALQGIKSHKLALQFVGPFQVLAIITNPDRYLQTQHSSINEHCTPYLPYLQTRILPQYKY